MNTTSFFAPSPDNQSEKAFTAVYQTYQNYLRRIAYTILRDPIVAREAVNNVFMRLWETQRFDQIQNLKTYLSRAVYNESLSLLQLARKHRTEVEQEILASLQCTAHSAQQALEAEDCEKKVHHALTRLPPRQRQVFIYARLQGLTHEEISQKLGISRHTVNEYIQEAQKKVALYMAMYIE